MLAAPTLSHVKNHNNNGGNAMCCILIAPLFAKVAKESVVPRIGYLAQRSAKNVHFYCAGYGGYWNKTEVPDMEDIGIGIYDAGTEIPWAFSQRIFGKFIDELERDTTWKYSGEAELFVMGADVNFSQCLIFNIELMLEDKAINNSSELFEAIIQYSRTSNGLASAYQFSDKKGGEKILDMTIESLLSFLPKSAQSLWKKGRHYTVKNIAR